MEQESRRSNLQDVTAAVEILNALLSDEYLLTTKTRNFHWNVQGPQFHDLHKLFEEQYQELDRIVDDVAERVRAVGGRALGTLASFGKNTRLKEEEEVREAGSMVETLLRDHEAITGQLRRDIPRCEEECQDPATANFLTDLLERHEKAAWMLRATLERVS